VPRSAPSGFQLSQENARGIEAPNAQASRSPQIATGNATNLSPAQLAPEPADDTFADATPTEIKSTTTEPVSTFSVDVDTAAYTYIRATLTVGALPDPASVRIEEMINYFDYAYLAPETPEIPFTTSVSVTQTPWNPGTQLLQIGLQGYEIPAEERPPLNLVFLIDTSGSMRDANKLPLLVSSFRLLLTALQPEDEIAIVTYAGASGIALPPTPAANRAEILATLGTLTAGGSTAGAAGLQQAYALAETLHREGETTRVILATDGDFNVGLSDPKALKTFIAEKRKTGTYLSVLGFGRGNLNDALMQSLAQNGNGIAAYIDTLAEAQRVLVDDMAASFLPIASDVKIQVEFNPSQISEYRLIGYETRALRREDFRNDAVDAGEIGAGHAVTALYEITPKGSPAEQLPPLRYSG
ncbi:MAG: von Willebrand factor type A domain-containing protein, partial [Pseudomonadota bacterium]